MAVEDLGGFYSESAKTRLAALERLLDANEPGSLKTLEALAGDPSPEIARRAALELSRRAETADKPLRHKGVIGCIGTGADFVLRAPAARASSEPPARASAIQDGAPEAIVLVHLAAFLTGAAVAASPDDRVTLYAWGLLCVAWFGGALAQSADSRLQCESPAAKAGGFSLWQFLVVVAVLGALICCVFAPCFQTCGGESPISKARQDLDTLRNAVNLYESRFAVLKTNDLAPIVGTTMQEIPPDPWGFPYRIDTRSKTLFTYGADGTPGGEEFDADIEVRYR